ncbi:MAG: DUF1611 domain-containing protein [Armatimonadetes bacterium]|nr:DUF1611 domain-containing protein [Armatimonadota bacterium]MDE2206397.1 DUF1611 domain-containing protein [Armatimonadota bacterium]
MTAQQTHRITPDDQLVLLMHGHLTAGFGKMGLGLLRYSPAAVTAVVDRDHAGEDLRLLTGIPRDAPIVATMAQALRHGGTILAPGVAAPGGTLPPDYWPEIEEALAAGLSLVNGLHAPLADNPRLKIRLRPGRWIWDIRQEPEGLEPGLGRAAALPNTRILTVGTDMGIGKMTASLEMHAAARSRGLRSTFVASGQIGIAISGDGVPVDAVRVDFASGAVERSVLSAASDADFLFIEGQGSILHPASTAWLPLIRGSCPTHMVLVHHAASQSLHRLPEVAIPPLSKVVRLYEQVAAIAGAAQPPPRVAAIALNTAGMSDADAASAVESTETNTGLPTADVLRGGAGKLVDAIIRCSGARPLSR